MEVDGDDLRTRTTVFSRDHTTKEYQAKTRQRDRNLSHPHLEDYNERDDLLIAQAKDGVAITDKVGLLALNQKNQARNRGYARKLERIYAGGEE